MFHLSVENAVAAIVEAMLPRFSPKDEGLLVTLDLRLADYSSEEDENKRASAIVRFLFVRPNNYTKVMYSTGSHILQEVPKEAWVMTSYHDSCWRSDGFRLLTKLYFDMSEKISSGPPARLSQHCWIDRIQRVKVELETYENAARYGNSYRPKTIEIVSDSRGS